MSTEHGTIAVYMKTPSKRPPVGAKVKIRGWRWPSVAVESRGGRRSSFLAMLAFDWQTVPPGFPAWGFQLQVQPSSCWCCIGFGVGADWSAVQWPREHLHVRYVCVLIFPTTPRKLWRHCVTKWTPQLTKRTPNAR